MAVVEILLFIIGLVGLLYGADKLTDAAAHIAHIFGIHPILIGMTILSVGTSIPEMATSARSFIIGHSNIAVGNIVGSDLVQITLILGLVAFINPLKGKRKEILFYGATNLFAILLAVYTIRDGMIDRFDGVVLCLAYILFLAHIIGNEHIKNHKFKRKHKKELWHLGLICVGALALVLVGSSLMVNATIEIATLFGIPEYLIAIFVVGLGTSLPELMISGIAAWKKQYSMSVGNLLGSNITDPLFSLGFGALFTSGAAVMGVASTALIYLAIASVVIIGIFAWKEKVSRNTAALCVLLYGLSFFFI